MFSSKLLNIFLEKEDDSLFHYIRREPNLKSVWKILQEIPYGETRSYKQQAMALGKPKAIRAVASANGHNRVSIIFHVIGL